jgi:hypothetical protein
MDWIKLRFAGYAIAGLASHGWSKMDGDRTVLARGPLWMWAATGGEERSLTLSS